MENPFKILIVEDNQALGENIRDILEINGYTVDSASHGKDAIISVQNNHYNIVIVDIKLPDITGTELVEKIEVISPATRYIYITGHATLDSTIRAIKQNKVVSYEVKPLNIDRLLLTIQQAKITLETETALKESEECLRQSQEIGHIGSWHWYLGTGKLFWSEETYRILGFTPGEVVPSYDFFLEKVHADDRIFFENAVNESLLHRHPINLEYRIIRKDGSERIAHAMGEIHLNSNGKPEKMFGIFQDITERKKIEEKLRKSEEKYRRLVEGLQDNYFFFTRDTNGTFTYISPSLKNILGYTTDEFHAHYLEYLTDNTANNNAIQRSKLNLKGIKQPPYDIEIYHKDGTIRILQLQEAPIFDVDKNIISIEGIAKDITEIKTFESQLVFLADQDPLTRLFNRRRFKEELERCLLESQRNQTKGALLFLDLDNFKYVNDTLGHHYGDELLIKLSDILKERLRQTDILARLGGDEFAIILPHTEEKQAQFISKQLLELTRNSLALDALNPLHITVSIGIAIFPTHGNNADTLLANADLAMYHAKEEGKNRDCIFSLKHKITIETQYDWKQRLRNALKQNNFVLHLQPIVSTKNNTVAGYEALLRLTEENNELVPPLKFLSIAERFGIIHEIDRWVVANAMNIIKELQLTEKNLFLEINLSGKAFSDNELLDIIREEIDNNSIHPKTLIFEITETAIIENILKAQHFIETLTSIGCRFSLDDFGSGFSSFNYLKHLPVDYLKIDGSFIHNLSHNSVDQHLVKGMVEVARGLKKSTVAEFVETIETFQLLQKIGVDYAQGHYFGKPLPIFEVLHN